VSAQRRKPAARTRWAGKRPQDGPNGGRETTSKRGRRQCSIQSRPEYPFDSPRLRRTLAAAGLVLYAGYASSGGAAARPLQHPRPGHRRAARRLAVTTSARRATAGELRHHPPAAAHDRLLHLDRLRASVPLLRSGGRRWRSSWRWPPPSPSCRTCRRAVAATSACRPPRVLAGSVTSPEARDRPRLRPALRAGRGEGRGHARRRVGHGGHRLGRIIGGRSARS